MDAQEFARDASGARAYAAFLGDLGERVPGALLPHVSLLMSLMDGEVGMACKIRNRKEERVKIIEAHRAYLHLLEKKELFGKYKDTDSMGCNS